MKSFQNREGKNASNKQGEGKVSKTGRKKKYLIKGGKGNASHKHEEIYPKKWRSKR